MKKNRRQYWREYEIARQRTVKKYAPGIYRVIRSQLKQFDAAAREDLSMALMRVPSIVTNEPMKEAIRPIYNRAAASYARKRYYQLQKMVKKDLIDWRALLNEFFTFFAGYRIVNITETTRRWIVDTVNKGLNEGLSYEEISKRLMNSGITQRRARMIARTESLTALNQASRTAAEKTGLEVKKVWVSAQDHRTRRRPKDQADHWVLNGETREPNEAFSNGLQQPGDVNQNKPEEIVNCRCCVVWEPVD